MIALKCKKSIDYRRIYFDITMSKNINHNIVNLGSFEHIWILNGNIVCDDNIIVDWNNYGDKCFKVFKYDGEMKRGIEMLENMETLARKMGGEENIIYFIPNNVELYCYGEKLKIARNDTLNHHVLSGTHTELLFYRIERNIESEYKWWYLCEKIMEFYAKYNIFLWFDRYIDSRDEIQTKNYVFGMTGKKVKANAENNRGKGTYIIRGDKRGIIKFTESV